MADSLSLLIKSAFDASGVTAATNSINRIDSQINKVSRGMQKFVGLFAAGGAISGVVAFGVSAVNAYAESEKGVAKLTQAMKNLGAYSERALKDQLDFATQMQAVTKYTDEQVVAVQTALTTYGLYGEELKRATKATLDMATQTGNADAAAMLVGKAYQGQTETLSRYGIKISETAVGAQKFNAVLTELQRRFGGMAEAEGRSFAGQLQIVKNRFDDLVESLGSKLMTPAIKVLDWFRDLDTVLGYISEKFTKAPRSLSDVNAEIKALQKAFKDSGNNNGMIYVGPLKRITVAEASARMKALVEEQKALKAAAASPDKAGGIPPGPAVDPEEARKRAAILEQIDDFQLSQRGRLYTSFFGSVNMAARRSYVAQAKSVEDMKDRQKKVLRDLEQEYDAAGRTISGGFTQAFLEMSASAANWRDNWIGIVNGAMAPAKAAVHEFFSSTSAQFLDLENLAKKVFQGILNSFLNLLEEMAAKAAIYGFLNLMSGGSLSGVTSLGKFLGFSRGGYTGDGDPNEVAGVVHKRELVLNEQQTAAVRSGRAVIGAPSASGGSSLVINQTINAGAGADVKSIFKAAAEGARKGVAEFVDFSKVTYKVGAKRAGETAL